MGSYVTYSGPVQPAVSTWHHYAVSRVGSIIRWFYDGGLKATTTDSGTQDNALYIGTYVDQQSSNGQNYKGWIDEMRIIRGTGAGIYTAAFTPDTDEYW